jgi:hypothetical protein
MLAAYRRSLVTLLQHGCRLAIDELLLSHEIGADSVTLTLTVWREGASHAVTAWGSAGGR